MTTFQGLDGELRVIDQGITGVTHYLEILFCDMNFSGPTSRARPEETMIMNRGRYDTDAHYTKGPDDPRYAGMPFSFSCRLADTVHSKMIVEWLSGTTTISATSGQTTIYTTKGTTTIDGVALPSFADTAKMAYHVEVLWDGSQDLGLQYHECYFICGDQTITESQDSVILSGSGVVYGNISAVTKFTTGYTKLT